MLVGFTAMMMEAASVTPDTGTLISIDVSFATSDTTQQLTMCFQLASLHTVAILIPIQYNTQTPRRGRCLFAHLAALPSWV